MSFSFQDMLRQKIFAKYTFEIRPCRVYFAQVTQNSIHLLESSVTKYSIFFFAF